MKIAKHDEYTRQYLTDLTVAREFLERYLPANILAKCDFSKLSVIPTSYIENDLKKHASDVVYRVGLKGSDNQYAYIYNLVEHQSTAIKDMPYRILCYQLAIIRQHKIEFPKDKKLPLVIPIVFYNGTKTPYPEPTMLADLFVDKELYAEIGLGNFKLADLTVIEDEEILQHGKLGLLEITLKHIRDRNFSNAIENIYKTLQIATLSDINEFLVYVTFSYLLSGREREELEPLLEQVKQNLPEYGGKIMSYAEELRQEGEQRGMQKIKSYAEELRQEGEQRGMQKIKSYAEELRQEGLQQGKQAGHREAQLEIARELLRRGMNKQEIGVITHLTPDQINELK